MPLYRVENLINNKGLWYHSSDSSASNVVHDLDLSNRFLPMDYDESLSKDRWKSAAETLEQLKFWFTHEDLLKLTPLGYKLYEIECDIIRQHTTEHYSHPLFQERGVKKRNELDIKALIK